MAITCYSEPATGRLPRQPSDGDEICDQYGNRWEYSSDKDAWLTKGVVHAPTYVSESQDGIISPDIYSKLNKLRTYLGTGVDLRPLKLAPGTDAYWYYFRSSDKCIRFVPEGPSALRIEIDKARLFQILMKEVCPGLPGPRGDRGDQGLDGRPGADETCFEPSDLHDRQLDFAIYTPTPLLAGGSITLSNDHIPNIAVRICPIIPPEGAVTSSTIDQLEYMPAWLHKSDKTGMEATRFQSTMDKFVKRALGQTVDENLCGIALSNVLGAYTGTLGTPIVTVDISPVDPEDITIASDLPIDEVSTLNTIKFDPETGITCGSIFLEPGNNWEDIADLFCVKCRQRGPDGIRGLPGDCMVQIVECTIDSSNITASCPMINARMDCDQDTIYSLCADVLEEVCVSLVSLLPDSDTLANTSVLDSVFAAAQVILDECKYINRYEVELKEDEIPELELVHWDPQPGCFTKRHYDRHKFDWVPETDIPPCDVLGTWYSPDDARPGKYPWDLVKALEPDDAECCEEDFFYCNVQVGSPSAAAATNVRDIHAMRSNGNRKADEISFGARRWNVKI